MVDTLKGTYRSEYLAGDTSTKGPFWSSNLEASGFGFADEAVVSPYI